MSDQLPGQMTVEEYLRSLSEPEDFSKYMNKPEFDPVREYTLRGPGFIGGKKRVVNFFSENTNNKKRADFLKREYGIGGFGIPGDEVNTIKGGNHDSKGNVIEYIDFDGNRKKINVSWDKLAECISKLIQSGEYQ